jgi:hypothetical protein
MKQITDGEKDMKVDLILFNSHLGDIFSCEDKPTSATEAEVDVTKARELREKRLKFVQTLLPYPSLISDIELISFQFHGLTLTIFGSRIVGDTIVHYKKGTATIPTTAAQMVQVANFLLVVMSLQVSGRYFHYCY